MCIEFTNLNTAWSMDSYPFPSINNLINKGTGCKLLSFMDAYSGYNQIKMRQEDEDKETFITEQGIFCFNVMPLGLKNARATF